MMIFNIKKNRPLFIKAKDVFSIIQSDYYDDIPFCLLEFIYNDKKYTIGSLLKPDCEMKKENIFFVFDANNYVSYDEFLENVVINGIKLADSEIVIEIIRAGIVDGVTILRTPWGDKRLANKAIKNQ